MPTNRHSNKKTGFYVIPVVDEIPRHLMISKISK